MKRVLRWVGYGLAGVLVLALLAAVTVYVASERIVSRTYDAPLPNITIPVDSSAIAEGQRLATIRGCSGGCHGMGVDGGVFFDEPNIARVVAPNLTRVAAEYSDAELARAIRQGVRADGRSLWAMPSAAFHLLSDDDLGKIIAFLRSLPPSDGPLTELHLRPLGRVGILLGEFQPQATQIDRSATRDQFAGDDRRLRGEYLARTICTECHGLDLRGEGAPNLAAIVPAYSPDAFIRLLRTGLPIGDRDLGLMRSMSVRRFSHMTDEEILSLHEYLSSM